MLTEYYYHMPVGDATHEANELLKKHGEKEKYGNLPAVVDLLVPTYWSSHQTY